MQSLTQTLPISNPAPISQTQLRAGRVIGILVVLFLLFDSTIKLLQLPAAVEGAVQAGYPAGLTLPIGITLLGCTMLYVISHTCVLGAILLTGYLGGATATMVRVENPWFLFPVVFGGLVWGSLFLRDERLRALIPMTS